ncbi:unnamed protein product, partial [Ectocarpus sp. 13 AM-2016]
DDDGAFSLSLKNQRIGKRCYIICTVLLEVDQVAWIWRDGVEDNLSLIENGAWPQRAMREYALKPGKT